MARYLFIGGPLHGQERETDGAVYYTALTQAADKVSFDCLPIDPSEPVFERTVYRLDRYACTEPDGLRKVYVVNSMTSEAGERALMRLLLKRWVMASNAACAVPGCASEAIREFVVGIRGLAMAGKQLGPGSLTLLCQKHADQLVNTDPPWVLQ